MLSVVLLLHTGRCVQVDVEHGIARVSEKIEYEEVEIKSDDTASLEVQYDLWIEGDGPGREIDPADDLNQYGHRLTVGDVDQKKSLSR